MKQIEEARGARTDLGRSPSQGRTAAAEDAGLSEHQRKTMLRVANVPAEERDRRIFDAWLACKTQEEIAEAEGLSQPQVNEITKNIGIGSIAKTDKAAAEHATDFNPPI